jgi:hypothetical protein
MPETVDKTGPPKGSSLSRQEMARQFVEWVMGLRFTKRAPDEPVQVEVRKDFDVWEFAPERPSGPSVFPENGKGRKG